MLKSPCSNFMIIKAIISLVKNFTIVMVFEPSHEKTCFMSFANNKGTDQPAHPCSLISGFVVRCLDSIIPILAKSKT